MNFDHVYIIAEAGINHDGSVQKASLLIDKAAETKADAVKFQMFRTDEIVSKDAPLADYQKLAGEESQYEMAKRNELAPEDFRGLKTYAEEKGLDFITTPFDAESARFLADLGVKAIKVPSGEITNLPFLREVAALRIFTIISTGMSNLEEIEEAVALFKEAGTPYALLHCVSSYPTPVNEVNLNAMKTMEKKFKVPIGFSDHTEGIAVAITAAKLGAKIIEKHFTINKNDPGPDHAASLEPHELTEMVHIIHDEKALQEAKEIEEALGTGEKQCQPCEMNTRDVARRSVQLIRDAKKGDVLTREMLAIKRPGMGISPSKLENVIGTALAENVSAGTPLKERHITQVAVALH